MKRAKGSKSTPLCICPMAITKAIEAMRESDSGLFRFADNEAEGNSITLNLMAIIRDITPCSTFTMDCAGYGGDKNEI